MVYPNRTHALSEGEGTTLHLRMLTARYLVEHLPADQARAAIAFVKAAAAQRGVTFD